MPIVNIPTKPRKVYILTRFQADFSNIDPTNGSKILGVYDTQEDALGEMVKLAEDNCWRSVREADYFGG